ncbi:SDR family oxidoreductase [Marinoscillum pacificum]|uniref:SDR family oxidoreductase n=1 Tax=Marinoscillum pacificum TaxID=392723 RepID=UPI002157A60B|nr:SDR family oxidoreductase [Marinoscillum pacificum]
MKVFVTGATGFIGSAVVQELLKHGHQVLGLARNEEAAEKLKAAGAEVHRGDLNDTESLKAGSNASDGTIHLGFIHDFTRFAEVCAIDKAAIESMGEQLIGTDKPFLVTSGTAVASRDGILTEKDRVQSSPNPRTATELAVDTLASKGVKVAAVRLPPSVHGVGDAHGFIPILVNMAREKGVSAMINEGLNKWPAVNRMDAAIVFRLALEKLTEPGTRFHAVDDQGVPFRLIADKIAKGLDVEVKSVTTEEAEADFTWFTHFAMFNNLTSSEATQKTLGWKPSHPSLLEDLDNGFYFQK